ncbi:methionyl-tRNA formyltransferase [Patescibacteria group bacterium]
MNNPEIIFFGTPEFAVPTLKALINNGYKPIAVVTAPDKPVGRKQIITPPPVKILAEKHSIKIIQNGEIPRADLGIIAAYGKIIPKSIIDSFPKGIINIHPSLLPKHRGASPIQTAILNNDSETGVTLMLTDEKMDHGPILAQSKIQVTNDKMFTELHNELAKLGAELLIETLPKWLNKEIKPIEQNHSKATYTKILKKEDGKIDKNKSCDAILRQIKAYEKWPTSWTIFKTKNKDIRIKILKAKKGGEKNDELTIVVKDGFLIIEELQPEGKKPMTARDFLNGINK